MESKVQAELACCLSTILWVEFCLLIHIHGMHQAEAIGGFLCIQTHTWHVLGKRTCIYIINAVQPFNWESATCA